MTANKRQVGGSHYQSSIQHWDYAASNNFDYFQGQITKYIHRWRDKNGIQDLRKALHFLEKYIETEEAKDMMEDDNGVLAQPKASVSYGEEATINYVCQDPDIKPVEMDDEENPYVRSTMYCISCTPRYGLPDEEGILKGIEEFTIKFRNERTNKIETWFGPVKLTPGQYYQEFDVSNECRFISSGSS